MPTNPYDLPTVVDFDADFCHDLERSSTREWLVTNGIGGYACGTVAGLLTRSYHGLLIAALKPPTERTLMLVKIDEMAFVGTNFFPLFENHWASGTIEPGGHKHISRFHLEGTTPVWTFQFGKATLQKRVWMQHGANTTYIRYDLLESPSPVTLHLKPIVDYRDHHGSTRGNWPFEVHAIIGGLRVAAHQGATPFYILASKGDITARADWFRDYYLTIEEERGLADVEDHVHAGYIRVQLEPGESVTVAASTALKLDLDGESLYQERLAYEADLLQTASLNDPDPRVQHLPLAADQFIVRRAIAGESDGYSVIAGYPWFTDWGRDTMISLPGLTLATGRADLGANILRTFARFVDQGMLPNHFPDMGEAPMYNTVDATLWYFEATRAYHAATDDDTLIRDLYPVLKDIISWHLKGTRYNIKADPADMLITQGGPDVQLTWMDAKVDDWVVTPRTGKPVEINGLWYNALRIMAEFASLLGESPDEFNHAADQVQASFGKFWNADLNCCFDVIAGPTGVEPALRPNQLIAAALYYSPLATDQCKAVVDVCAKKLLTPRGLRSLSPDDPRYIGTYIGDRYKRDGAYHQGTVWGWLIGPFISAHLKAYSDKKKARKLLLPLLDELGEYGLGSLSEIADGNPPHQSRGCFAQAWSVAEVLRVLKELS